MKMKAAALSRSLVFIVAGLTLTACRSGPGEGWSSRARTMDLTSGPTEVVLSSSRVPGYWAQELFFMRRRKASGQEFFLYTSDRSYKKGDRVTVEGPFGLAAPTVFRNEGGEYMRWYSVHILVVWKIGKEVASHAPRP